jgi:hypothetical protein
MRRMGFSIPFENEKCSVLGVARFPSAAVIRGGPAAARPRASTTGAVVHLSGAYSRPPNPALPERGRAGLSDAPPATAGGLRLKYQVSQVPSGPTGYAGKSRVAAVMRMTRAAAAADIVAPKWQ